MSPATLVFAANTKDDCNAQVQQANACASGRRVALSVDASHFRAMQPMSGGTQFKSVPEGTFEGGVLCSIATFVSTFAFC
jgi:hypothetical protein